MYWGNNEILNFTKTLPLGAKFFDAESWTDVKLKGRFFLQFCELAYKAKKLGGKYVPAPCCSLNLPIDYHGAETGLHVAKSAFNRLSHLELRHPRCVGSITKNFVYYTYS